jgi:NAD(P)H-dependent FMN reductase
LLHIGIVIASTRPERVGPNVAAWVLDLAERRGDAHYELVDLRDQDLPLLDEPEPASSGNYTQEHTRAWAEKVSALDAFVFVTPEYNRGLPASLKNALDFLYAEWNNKAAGVVCYGSSTGLRASEHLRSVLGELQIATVRAQVALSIFTDMENFRDMAPADYQERNLTTMLDQLVAWGGAMAQVRARAAT